METMPVYIDWLENKALSPPINWPGQDLENLGVRPLDARSLEDLLN
jgi:hypothetical protein